MKRGLIICLSVCLVILMLAIFWYNTQRAWPVDKVVNKEAMDILPSKNRKIIELVETKGYELAPSYKAAVCTEFVIKVIDNIESLTKAEKNDIRIITDSRWVLQLRCSHPTVVMHSRYRRTISKDYQLMNS